MKTSTSPLLGRALLAIVAGLASLFSQPRAATIMLPEKAMWGKGFFQVDTMDCEPPAQPPSGEYKVVCKGDVERRQFRCEDSGLLMTCRTTILELNSSTSRGANGSTIRTTTSSDRDLVFFLDSTRLLRHVYDPELKSYLSNDPAALAYYNKHATNKRLAFWSSVAGFAGAVGLCASLLTTGIEPNATNIGTGALFVGGGVAQWYFNLGLDDLLEKGIAEFRKNRSAGGSAK